MNKKLTLIACIAMAAIATPAYADGLIGEDYAYVGGGYRNVESGPNGLLGTVGANFAVHTGPEYGIDVHTSYGQVHLSTMGDKFRSHVLSVDLRGHTVMGTTKPFAEFNTGWQWDRTVIGPTKTTADSLIWGFTVGSEFELTDAVSLTPSLSWIRWDDFRANQFSFELAGHMWVTDTLGVGLAYTLGEGSDLTHTGEATVTFRF